MKGKGLLQPALGILIILSVLFMLTACSGIKSNTKNSASNQVAVQKTNNNQSTYYIFGDVLLPKQLKIINSKSFVFSVSGVTSGVLSLKGRVEINSLIKFFENKMPMDGWTLENKFQGQRNMLLFTKPNRNSVITIDEGTLNTYVEIWVAPTNQGAVSGLHK